MSGLINVLTWSVARELHQGDRDQYTWSSEGACSGFATIVRNEVWRKEYLLTWKGNISNNNLRVIDHCRSINTLLLIVMGKIAGLHIQF